MYVLIYALQNLRRHKGRNIMVSLVLFAVIATTVITLIISNTAAELITHYRTRFTSEVFLVPDFDYIMASGQPAQTPRLTSEVLEQASHSPYLAHYALTAQTAGFSQTQVAVGEDSSMELPPIQIMNPDGELSEATSDFNFPTLQLIASTDPATFSEFETGSRQLIEGEMFQDLGEAIVSSEFAQLNQLSIGDTITVNSIFSSYPEPLYLTVTGIYLDTTENPNLFGVSLPSNNRRNEILTSFETLQNASQFAATLQLSGRYFLNHPQDLPYFEAELRSLGVSYAFQITTNEDTFHSLTAPIQGLRSISITFMVLVLSLGAFVLILLSGLSIRERKYEIGVLRAMGMKKNKVALGLVAEMTTLTLLCLILGLGAGNLAAQPIANTLLAQQVEALPTEDAGNPFNLAPGRQVVLNTTTETVEPPSEINLQLQVETFLQMGVIALGLATLSSAIGIAAITKYEPMKILAERN